MQTHSLMLSVVILSALITSSSAGEPVVIATGSEKQAPKQPQAAVDNEGLVHLVYGVGSDVFHCVSNKRADKFSSPSVACRVPNLSLGMRRGPRVATSGKNIVISAIGGQQGKGRDGDVLAYRSSDGGDSWQGPVRINDTAASAREGLHAMSAGTDGSVWCVWLDLRAKQTELYASQSKDGGETWSKNVLVYHSPDGSICECCHPSIAIGGSAIHILFRNSLGGNRDMYMVTSNDGGAHFGEAVRLGNEPWQLNACPMDGGMLAIDNDNTIATAWRRGGLVYATRKSRPQETLLGKGEQPWLASTAKGPLAVWTKSREGELVVSSITDPEPRTLAASARDPVIASATSGNGPVIVCWESNADNKNQVMVARVD